MKKKKISFTKKIQEITKNILQDRFLISLLSLSFGICIGLITFNTQILQASLIQKTPSELNYKELDGIFTELENKKEVEINRIGNNTFLVEFFATEGEGSSLHPYVFIVKKEGNTLISVNEF